MIKLLKKWFGKKQPPADYINALDVNGRYHNSKLRYFPDSLQYTVKYTMQMYMAAQLPGFVFKKEFRFKQHLGPFRPGDQYPAYSYSHAVLIDLLRRGIITEQPAK